MCLQGESAWFCGTYRIRIYKTPFPGRHREKSKTVSVQINNARKDGNAFPGVILFIFHTKGENHKEDEGHGSKTEILIPAEKSCFSGIVPLAQGTRV